jgi:hypothetical protein
MLDDDKLYRHTLWAGVAVLITMIGSCTASGMDRRAKWADAVKNGADPIAVACALYDQSEAEKVTCALVATKK